MERGGAAGERSAQWTSTYGSLAVSGYDISTADGMNEAGLVVNLLWEVEAVYPEDDGETPRISLSVFPQYLLDRYATGGRGGGRPARQSGPCAGAARCPWDRPEKRRPVHVSMSDATGDSAIIEFSSTAKWSCGTIAATRS